MKAWRKKSITWLTSMKPTLTKWQQEEPSSPKIMALKLQLTSWTKMDLMFEAELPLLEKFIATVDFAIANILDLYDQSTLPEIDIPEIETDEAPDNV